MAEEPIVFEAAVREAIPSPPLAHLHLELRCNGEIVAESHDEKLWARVLVLLLEAERPEHPEYAG